MNQLTIDRDGVTVDADEATLRNDLVSPEVRRELVQRRLQGAFGRVRFGEAARQLALDALGLGQPDEVRAEEAVWLSSTLDIAAQEVADVALEQLAAVVASSLAAAPPCSWRRLTQGITWNDVDGL